MKRLWTALGLFVVLAVLAWTTISDQKFRLAAVAVLAMFAVRTWTWSRKQERDERERHDEMTGPELIWIVRGRITQW